MILTFERQRVETLLANTKAATKWKTLYEQPETAKAGLWLVGDNGIYLMSNSDPAFLDPAKPPKNKDDIHCYVAYAQECNPERQAFDEWWHNKRQSFGGSDGVEFVPAEDIDKWFAMYSDPTGKLLYMELTMNRRALLGSTRPTPVRRKENQRRNA